MIISEHLQHFRLASECLASGQLHPEMVHRLDIQFALNHIADELRVQHSQARVLIKDPSFFYRVPHFVAAKVHTTLFISIIIPLTTVATSFDLYEVVVYPRSVHDQIHSATLIEKLPKYFAIAQDNSLYAIWDSMPKLETGDNIYFIDTLDINLITDLNSCIFALYKNDAESIAKLCQFQLLAHKPQVLIPFSQTAMIIENIYNLSLTCPNVYNKPLQGCGSCVITKLAACSVTSNNILVPASVPQIKNESKTLLTHKSYAINSIILQTFFHPDQWKQFHSQSLSDHKWNLVLPDFHIAAKDAHKNILLQEEFNSTIEAVKKGEILFQNNDGKLVSESKVQGQNNKDYLVNILLYINITLYALVIAIIIFNIYLYFKLNALACLILALSAKVKISDAHQNFLYPLTPAPQPICHCSSNAISYALIAFLTLLTLIFCAYFIWLRFKANESVMQHAGEKLYLRFSNSIKQMDIFWITLPYEIQQCDLIARNSITDIRIQSNLCSNVLSFNWDLEITHNSTHLKIKPDSQISLRLVDSIGLKQIVGLNRHYTVSLILMQKTITRSLVINPHFTEILDCTSRLESHRLPPETVDRLDDV